jgi:AraC-like DNA-binding protein
MLIFRRKKFSGKILEKMIVKDFQPSPVLQEFISQYRFRHFIFPKGIVPKAKPFPPRPEQCLTFYVRGTETTWYMQTGLEITKPRSVISGQFTYRADRYVSYPEILMIIVDFKPGALHRLTGIPFREFTNSDIDAESVFSPEINRVNERLNSCATYSEMLGIVEAFFIDLARHNKKDFLPLDRLLSLAIHDTDRTIDWMAEQACLSPRQLERKFDERIGINPKTLLRICRFNRSYWMHLRSPKLTWFDIAITCGYTDYQHLAKEYKIFTETTPNLFFEEESNAPGRMLGLNK